MASSVWSTQELAEFVAVVSSAERPRSAAQAAVERAAVTFDAPVAAIVGERELIASVGDADRASLVSDPSAVSAALDHPPGTTFMIARPGSRGFSGEDVGLLGAMAQVTSMTMRTLSVLDAERAAREEVERLARDQAALRRVATLVAEAAPRSGIFAAVAAELAQGLGAEAAAVVRYDTHGTATIVGGWGAGGISIPVGAPLVIHESGVAAFVRRTHRPMRVESFVGPPGTLAAHFSALGVRSGVAGPILVEDSLWGVAVAGTIRPEGLAPESDARVAEFAELVAAAIANAEARTELRITADEQTRLRRVATAIARGAAPDIVFATVAEEVCRVLPAADVTYIGRYDERDAVEFVGAWSRAGEVGFLGERVRLGGHNVATLVLERNAPARVDRLVDDDTPATALARKWAQSAVGAPITVEGRLWGVMVAGARSEGSLPPGIEHRLAQFTELVATALGNAQARDARRRVADEQAALRRVATLVVRDAAPEPVFAAVAEEIGRLLSAQASVVRYHPDGAARFVGTANVPPGVVAIGDRMPLGGANVTTRVFATRRPVRIDGYPADDASPATKLASGRSQIHSAMGAPISVRGRLWGAALAGTPRERGFPHDAQDRLADFAELAATAIANAEARAELRRGADEQSALRRVATLVAEGAAQSTIFATVAEEAARLLAVEQAHVARYDADDSVTILGAGGTGDQNVDLPSRHVIHDGSLAARVRDSARAARIDRYPDELRALAVADMHSSVGAPITVDGRLWGLISVSTAGDDLLAPDTEARLAAFATLVAAAIANAQAQADLAASRARMLASADQTRRRIERELHEGAQQSLATVALQLRAVQAAIGPRHVELTASLAYVAATLNDTLDELREIARGIHPAILAEGGLSAALRTLARRSPVPVTLNVRAPDPPAERVEIAAYYVVSEALANAAKHAHAAAVTVDVEGSEDALRIRVGDDGVGGAEFVRGSGLIGLRDRVEAIGGRISVDSPLGTGTSLWVELPLS